MTTPDGLSRIASNSRSAASGPLPNPARSTPAGFNIAQRWAIAHSAAADAAPCGSVGPSVRYSSTGATAPSDGFAATAPHERERRTVHDPASAAARNGAMSSSVTSPAASRIRLWISGSSSGPAGGASTGRRRWKTLRGNSQLKNVDSNFSNCVVAGRT